ncbi:MAG: hypothetical protein P8184_12615 [Calditrichia bacterium]
MSRTMFSIFLMHIIFVLSAGSSLLYAGQTTADTLKEQRGLPKQLRRNSGHVRVERDVKGNTDYIHYYRYRLSFSLKTAYVNLNGGNDTWETNGGNINAALELQAASRIFENQAVNMSFSYCFAPGAQNFKIFENGSDTYEDDFETYFHQLNLYYSYTFRLKNDLEVAPGLGVQLVMYDIKNPLHLSLNGGDLSPVLNVQVLKPLSRRLRISGRLSYSVHNLEIKSTDLEQDIVRQLRMTNFQVSIGLQFLTGLTEVFQ